MIVHVPTATPRDRHRPTIRLVPLGRFDGLPTPGQAVEMQYPGVLATVPGFVHFFDARLGVAGVEPDFQVIHGGR